MACVAIIPARGGSKEIKNKNIVDFNGLPLLSWTARAALNSRSIDRVIVSTDSTEIADIARKEGCDVPFLRPEIYATDKATTVDCVLHALDNLPKYEKFVLLQPTSPLRTSKHIDECIKLMDSLKASSIISISKCETSPHHMFWRQGEHYLESILKSRDSLSRRQDLEAAYYINGAIYCINTDVFLKTRSFIMDNTACFEMPRIASIDIDDKIDLMMAEYFMQNESPCTDV